MKIHSVDHDDDNAVVLPGGDLTHMQWQTGKCRLWVVKVGQPPPVLAPRIDLDNLLCIFYPWIVQAVRPTLVLPVTTNSVNKFKN